MGYNYHDIRIETLCLIGYKELIMTQQQKSVFVITDDETEAEMDAEALAKKNLHATKTEPRTPRPIQNAQLIGPETAKVASPAVAAPKVPVTQEHATILSTPAPPQPAKTEIVGVSFRNLINGGARISEQDVIATLEGYKANGGISDNSRIILFPKSLYQSLSNDTLKLYHIIPNNTPLYTDRKRAVDKLKDVESIPRKSEPLSLAPPTSVLTSENKEPNVKKSAIAPIQNPEPPLESQAAITTQITKITVRESAPKAVPFAEAIAGKPETAPVELPASKENATQNVAVAAAENKPPQAAAVAVTEAKPLQLAAVEAANDLPIVANEPKETVVEAKPFQTAAEPPQINTEPELRNTDQEYKFLGAEILKTLAKFFSWLPDLISKIFTPSGLPAVDTDAVKARPGVEGTQAEGAKAQAAALAASGGGNVHAASPAQEETHDLGTSHH